MGTRQEPPDPSAPGTGREAQRRRTRRALVEATRGLLAAGVSAPTVDAVAAAADVSRRTVYVHFPSLDQLVLDASLGALSEAYVGTALARSAADLGPGDAHARVQALVDAVLDQADATLPLGRAIIRLTVDRPADQPVDPGAVRGQRRVGWIESALAPAADLLSAEQHERLVSGLALVVGFEAMVVLRDVRGLDAEREREVSRWAARALVDAVLAE